MKFFISILLIAALLAPYTADAERLWSTGAELNDITTAGTEFFLTSGAGCSIASTGQRSGSYTTRCTSAASTRQGFVHQFQSSSNAGPFYFRFYLYVDTAPNANNSIFVVSSGTSISSTALVTLYMQSTRELVLFLNGITVVGSPSAALNTGQWYRIEVMVDNTPAPGLHVVRALIDGTEFAGANDLTMGNYQAFRWGTNMLNSGSVSSGTFLFDDIAVNNTTGTAQTSYPGAGSIVHCHPNAAGDNAATAGLVGAIDEVTPNDATDFIELDTDGGMTADYNIDAASTCGIDSYDTVNLVQVGVRERAETVGAESWVLRVKSQASGTVTEGSATTHDDTTWRTNGDQTPQYNYRLTSYTDPQAGGSWTPSLLDTAQIGIRTTDGNPDVHVSTLWALVEYTDGGSPATPMDITSGFILFE